MKFYRQILGSMSDRIRPKGGLLRLFFVGVLISLVLGVSAVSLQAASPTQVADEGIWADLSILSRFISIDSYGLQGNLETGWVTLDGVPLFEVAALVDQEVDVETTRLSNLEWRLNDIEQPLRSIVNLIDFSPADISVNASRLNNEWVVIASEDDWQLPLLTITEEDKKIDPQFNDFESIAKDRAAIIKAAFRRAYEERQFRHQVAELWNSVQIVLLLAALSITLFGFGRLLKLFNFQITRYFKKKRRTQAPQTSPAPEQSLPEDGSIGDSGASPSTEAAATADVASEPGSAEPSSSRRLSWSWRRDLQRVGVFLFELWRVVYRLLQMLLPWMQLILWVGGITWILFLFHQTRYWSQWLLRIPFSLILIFLVTGLVKNVIDSGFYHWLRYWGQRPRLSNEQRNRFNFRFKTLMEVFKDTSLFVGILIGILWFLGSLKVPVYALLAGVGLLGFGFQDTLKDMISGVFILWEDYYAMGDIVAIGDYRGEVEYLDIKLTKLRSRDGELTTIENRLCHAVSNYSNRWARATLSIEVAYSTDLDHAIATIDTVAQTLFEDPQWHEFILESPKVLGVNAFSESSITILVIIKTVPKKQWDIAREYRLRLKKAFDQAGIEIPFPQRSIWIHQEPRFKVAEGDSPNNPL